MPFKSSIDSWATIDVVWEEVTTGSWGRTASSEHSPPRERAGQDPAQASPRPMEENRE